MRLELLPLILGVLVILGGLALLADAYLPETAIRSVERRRRARAERNRRGETAIGLGLASLGAALVGRDGWRFGNVAILVGVVCLVIGAISNRAYLREALTFRGAARRGRSSDRPRDGAPDA